MNKTNIVYPDYKRSIINITASILDYFGCLTNYPGLSELSNDYLNRFDNIIFIVADGLGVKMLEKNLPPKSLFRSNMVTSLTSVFPPTTSAAISSYLSGLSPLEHGIIGWTLYFKEYFRLIDYLPLQDASTGEQLPDSYDVHSKFHFKSIFKIISEADAKVQQHYVTPLTLSNSKYTKMASNSAKIYSYLSLSHAFDYIQNSIKQDKSKKLFYCYSAEPDKSMHSKGVANPEVTEIIKSLQEKIIDLRQKVSHTKTLIIVTSDHGMIDIDETIYANDEICLWDSLILPTFPEARFISCFVHKEKKADFLKFCQKYKSDFLVLEKQKFLQQGLLGKGKPHPRLLEMIGDYVLIAKGSKLIQTKYAQTENPFKFTAMHSGLTADEMLVPLILLD